MRAGLATDGWKRSVDDYVFVARGLLQSIRRHGFLLVEAVPIDPNGELLNGAHRVACALALGIDAVPVKREARYAWAPGWGYEWFVAAGMGHDDLERLCRDFKELTAA